MRRFNARHTGYRDPLAQKRRRLMMARIFGGALAVCAVFAVGLYGFFFSPVFRIQQVTVQGLEVLEKGEFEADISSVLNLKQLKFFEFNKNIILFNPAELAKKFLAKYPILKSVNATRTFAREIKFEFRERKPLGQWCISDACVFFDGDGVSWGKTPKSTGKLFAIVNDMRPDAAPAGKDFLGKIKEALEFLPRNGVEVKEIVIPREAFREFRVVTAQGYAILFSLDSDIVKQARAVKLFLDKKAGDPDFLPEYLDLRIDGRIYYK